MIKLIFFILSLSLLVLVFGVIVFLFVLTPADRAFLLNSKHSLKVDNTKRTYALYNESSDEPRPLIIALHGFRDRSTWMGAYSGLHILADNEDVTLALPDGQRQSWNASFCCGWSFVNQAEDAAFIKAMIDEIKQNHAIDERNVYILGFSNGGIMAQKMLAEYPNVFTAGASLMSGVGNQSEQLDISRATAPLLLINGNSDQYVPLEDVDSNRNDFQFTPAQQTADIWANHYGLSTKTIDETSQFARYRWRSDANRQLEQHIYDSSHRWPDWRLWGFPKEVPTPTAEIWYFFQYHHR